MMIEETLKVSERIKDDRNVHEVFMSLQKELGELAEEIEIAYSPRRASKSPGPDGVSGEAIDCILCLLDLIKVHNPVITPEEIVSHALKKLKKWEAKYHEHNGMMIMTPPDGTRTTLD